MVNIKYKVVAPGPDGKPVTLKGVRALKPGETFTLDFPVPPAAASDSPEVPAGAPLKV